MISQVMNLINTSLSGCSQLFLRVFNASGMVEFYISILFIVLAFKYILSPVIGSSKGSDRARGNTDE